MKNKTTEQLSLSEVSFNQKLTFRFLRLKMSALLRQLFTKACSLSKCNINTILPATSVSLVSNIDKSRFFSDTHTAYEVIDDKKDKLESQGKIYIIFEAMLAN